MARVSLKVAAVIALALVLFATADGVDADTRESAVKAAFLYNFAQLTEWPTNDTRAFIVCFSGASDMAIAGSQLSGREVHGRSITIREATAPDGVTDCDMIFVGQAVSDDVVEALLAEGHGAPILSVSTRPDFIRQDGHIQLFRNGDSYRFRINLPAVRSSRLEMSSRLLQLAEVIGHDD